VEDAERAGVVAPQAVIEYVIPTLAIEVEQALRITGATIGSALSVTEAAALKGVAVPLRGTPALTLELEKVAFEVNNVRKAAGTISLVNTSVSGSEKALAVMVKNGDQFQVIARVTVAAAGANAVINILETPPNQEPSNSCTFCRKEDVSLCKKLEKLANATSKTDAVIKLCNSSLTNLSAIVDKINTLGLAKIAFLSDIADVNGVAPKADDIRANVNSLTLDLIDAWKLVYDAAETKPKFSSNYQRDMEVLKQVKNMLSSTNSTSLTKLGGSAGLIEILQKHYTAPCYTCTNNAGNSHLRYMDGYLKDIMFFVSTYANTTGATQVLAGSGIKNSSIRQVRSTAYMLDFINKNNATNFTSFEDNLSAAPFYGCKPDAREGAKIIEFKSWSYAQSVNEEEEESESKNSSFKNMFKTLADFDFKPNSYNTYTQFRCYMSNIDKMSDLQYYFDGRKGVGTEIVVKEAFRDLLYNKASSALTLQGQEIFEVIWGRTALRANLFGVENSTDARLPFAKTDFISMISTLDIRLFKFIKVE
jgi:hypothetical protein